MHSPEVRQLYQRAIEMNADAFAREEFDVAYHALMAALHSGQSLEDVECLREVERAALKQMRYIDGNRPEYQHSTQSTQLRVNHPSIFSTAARQANARIVIIERAKAVESRKNP